MKAVLVIDMPKTCGDCLLGEFADKEDMETEIMFCNGKRHELGEELAMYDEKPSWCPLNPLPDRKEDLHYPCNEYVQAVNEGWNACLDEITGGTE